MKLGTVFIAWSGSNELAMKVAEKILCENTYSCIIGGNHKLIGNSIYVGDTILGQLQMSNQAVFLIEKKKEGNISNNVMFELGFALSKFDATPNKIHIYYIDMEENDQQIPSDLRGAWATYLYRQNKTNDELAEEIYREFIRKQKLEIPENKMQLINNWHTFNHEIKHHLTNPSYSDYEFAQYLLFYTQAACLFGNVDDSKKKLETLSRKIDPESIELYNTIALCITTLDFFTNINTDSETKYMTDDAFMSIYERYKDAFNRTSEYFTETSTGLSVSSSDELRKWTLVIGNEKLSYAYLLYANNPELSLAELKEVCDDLIKCGVDAIKYCDELISSNMATNVELATLVKAYLYRGLAVMYDKMEYDKELRNEYFRKSLEERKNLLVYYKNPNLDARLLKIFDLEYQLSVAEVTPLLTEPREIRANIKGMHKYLEAERKEIDHTLYYYKRIESLFNDICSRHPEVRL